MLVFAIVINTLNKKIIYPTPLTILASVIFQCTEINTCLNRKFSVAKAKAIIKITILARY
ncbi:MAG: hypothetical protein U5K53_05710 [Halanaerobiales bacterium]|nr:hypothetical protein [Halanaerobiales bacterium]